MKRGLLLIAAVVVVAAPAAFAYRAPTQPEKAAIVKGLPAFYHQTCIRYSIRISSKNERLAGVFFSFTTNKESKTCKHFDGQVLMRRTRDKPYVWRKIGEGSSWGCKTRGATAAVVKELFGGCH